jgi:5-formyltetrahydrofolate cyclo-ligase
MGRPWWRTRDVTGYVRRSKARAVDATVTGVLTKDAVRTRGWDAIREAGVARFPGVDGRIPNFVGAEAAAERLAESEAWQRSKVIKANPDSPQLPVRKRALRDGKVVYMAVPRLSEPQPFWRLDPERLDVPVYKAATIGGAPRAGVPVGLDEMEHIDLIVCGSVAVERSGARLGKGGGYSDLEFALTVEAGHTTPDTVIATTVHPCQIVEEGVIPVTEHDFPLDLVATPDEVITTHTTLPRPPGVLAEHLGQEKLRAIPVLHRR